VEELAGALRPGLDRQDGQLRVLRGAQPGDFDPATSAYKLYTPNYFLQAISVKYEADKWSVTGGVRNFADRKPPTISQGVYSTVGNALLYSGFDYFGRSYFLNITRSF
jgi:outer membrane receptor for ferrienterochelin and colicin